MSSSFDNMFGCPKIPLTDILTATNNFADQNLIAGGGFGRVYKGKLLLLSSGETIDIVARWLDPKYGHGTKQFVREIQMLCSLKHQNLVSIVGFCDEHNEKIIINKFEARGSLDRYLSDPDLLSWTQRLNICLGTARALSYIHYDKGRDFSVIHRNIKSAKILLDDNWEPKLCGFDLSTTQPAARWLSLVLDNPCGTPGYIDPAYVRSSSVSHKSDVYSFGVVLFEVLTGRNGYLRDNETGEYLNTLARSYYENGRLSDIIHPDLLLRMEPQSLKVFSEAAYRCLHEQRSQRPHINQVIYALEQALVLQLGRQNLGQSSTRDDEATSTDYWKDKNMEHLKIKFDAIKLATNNFSKEYLIGTGGYGAVYKAELEHYDSFEKKYNKSSYLGKRRSVVAIKYIHVRLDDQGEEGFKLEIETLSCCKHPNIVPLLGFCDEQRHMILVYEHVPNGSLDDYLANEDKRTILTWVQCIKICIDIARGLDYLHTPTDYKQKIYHLDIKSANILLGENLEAKIADFGLSRFHPLNKKSTIVTNRVVGTQVYLDPEYESTGRMKIESDVYSLGVVLFEILTGRLAYDPVYTNVNGKGLAPIARQHFENGTLKEIIDPAIMKECNENIFIPSKGPNVNSLNIFSKIGYECINENQAKRPTIKVIIEKLEEALNFQVTHKDNFHISFEDIRLATQDFKHQIGRGGFGFIYKGDGLHANNGPTPIAVKRHVREYGQGEREFLQEVEILFEYKHKNIIDFIGYCDENNEKILVYDYASNGSLNRHLKEASLGWTQRLEIAIDVATGLEFLHGVDSTHAAVIHRDIKSANILLDDDWTAKITDFGLSIITAINNGTDFVIDDTCGTPGYVDPQYEKRGFLTRESDIYSLGVVLAEMMCGRLTADPLPDGKRWLLGPLFRRGYEEGTLDELVFGGIKDKIMPNSLATYQMIAYQCLNDESKGRPSASEVIKQLNRALEFQEDIEIWEAKLPRDYTGIIQMSKTPENYSNLSNKDLYHILSKGILLQNSKVLFSLGSNGERNEMVSATMFSYEKNILHKRISHQNSRFQRVVKLTDVLNLKIQIKIKTQFLSPNVVYGAHLVFKFCDLKKVSSKLMYVNLVYRMGGEDLHAYFATRGDDEWMMVELCRFKPRKKDVKFEVLLESLSRYYCGNGAIFVEGIHFRAISDETLKMKPEEDENMMGQERLESDSDLEEITELYQSEKMSSLIKDNGKKCHMLPAKMVLYDSSNMKCFSWKSLSASRFPEAAEVLSQQVFRIKCKIETQNLSPDTDYACYLVFELSERCHGLQCPVKVKDVRHKKCRDSNIVYFRSPMLVNFHDKEKVPKHRGEDGLMEVIVWEFKSGKKVNDGDVVVPVSLKLRCYEGSMAGLVVYGIEFRPV